MHHRVKNNLQIISSLLNLERNIRTDGETKKVLLEARQRIKSMALIHKNLYQYDDLSEIKILPYLRELVHGIHQTYKDRVKQIKCEVESDVRSLDVDRAIPMGLIITELVSNSYKYAFRKVDSGEIKVEIKKKESGFTLIVSDNGAGMKTMKNKATQTESLGLRLVDLLANQLRATYTTSVANGTCFIFEFEKQINKSRS